MSQSTVKKNEADDADAKHPIDIVWARVAIFSYLIIACIVCGWGSHFTFSQYEYKLQFAGYSAIVDELAIATGESMKRDKLSTQLLASATGLQCPDAAVWPNCTMPLQFFEDFASIIISTSEMTTLTLNPILTVDQVKPYEEFVYDFYGEEGYGKVGIGAYPYINGIFGVNVSNGRSLYHTSEPYPDGENPVFVPIYMMLGPNKGAVNYNLYTDPGMAKGVDDVISCVNSVEDLQQCGSITDIIYLNQDGVLRPAALTFHPVFPYNDNSTLVATAMSVLNWDSVLNDHLPGSIADIEVVISSEAQKYTYIVQGGNVILKGEGDLHDREYDNHRVTVPLTTFPHSSISYQLSIYPTAAYAKQSSTLYPIYASVIAVLVIILTSFVVFLYDFSVAREVREKEVVMETKRLFVRYISHEIRTPLNTVHLGLVVLMGEMERVIKDVMSLPMHLPTHGEILPTEGNSQHSSDRVDGESGKTQELKTESDQKEIESGKEEQLPKVVEPQEGVSAEVAGVTVTPDTTQLAITKSKEKIAADITSWITLINEIEESSDVAVTVLNDLINYDKIVGGLLKMDMDEVLLWPLLLSTIKPFNLQAKEKNIKIKMYNNCSEEDMKKLIVFADNMKLAQVMRNLVSNALKFTPRGGSVTITVEWIHDDQLNTDMSYLDNGSSENPINLAKFRMLGNVCLSVKDSGVGMTGENLKELFHEGVQFNPNQLQGGQGSGLGLWVSKGFVVRHGGTLTATSEGIGKGSTFSMQLPVFVARGENDAEPELKSVMRSKSKASPQSGVFGFLCPDNGRRRRKYKVLAMGAERDDFSTTCEKKSSSASQSSKSQSRSSIASHVDVEFFGGDSRVIAFNNEIQPMKRTNRNEVNDVSHLVESDAPQSRAERCEVLSKNIAMHSHSSAVGSDIDRQNSNSVKAIVSKSPKSAQAESLFTPTQLEAKPIGPGNADETKNDEESAQAAEPEVPLRKEISQSLKKITSILVVDDAGSNRKILCRLLKNGGFTVADAEDGHICVDMVAKTLPVNGKPSESSTVYDLILMDYQMPVMNGPIAAKKLRELGYNGPIVGITGNVLDSDMANFITNGAVAVMSKPIQFSALSKLINKLEAGEDIN